MPSGKTFFGIGSRKQRGAGEQTPTQMEQHADPSQIQRLRQKSQHDGHATDIAVTRDQGESLHEGKKPSVFKQLFQKCECHSALDCCALPPRTH
jgi:hypothetical protein